MCMHSLGILIDVHGLLKQITKKIFLTSKYGWIRTLEYAEPDQPQEYGEPIDRGGLILKSTTKSQHNKYGDNASQVPQFFKKS
jgi:hypothetical protein